MAVPIRSRTSSRQGSMPAFLTTNPGYVARQTALVLAASLEQSELRSVALASRAQPDDACRSTAAYPWRRAHALHEFPRPTLPPPSALGCCAGNSASDTGSSSRLAAQEAQRPALRRHPDRGQPEIPAPRRTPVARPTKDSCRELPEVDPNYRTLCALAYGALVPGSVQ